MPHRLLLADDSVTIQKVIELTFADEDVTVVAVGDGDQAIARLEAESFDIVLADVGMPGKDGYEVAVFLRDRPGTRVPVLLLTGAFDVADDQRVAAVGASGVLAKPFEPQVLVAKVRALLAGATGAVALAGTIAPMGRPAEAIAAAPPTGKTPTVDDYFERLDRAFESLNVPLDLSSPASAPARSPGAAPPVIEHTARTAGAVSDQHAEPSPSHSESSAADPTAASRQDASRSGLADRFATLLAVEQGELPPSALAPPPGSGDDELVDRIARRVVEQLGDRAVRDLAADIVSRTAERLVREEIERIKGN